MTRPHAMRPTAADLEVRRLGASTVGSPLLQTRFVDVDDRVLLRDSLRAVRELVREGTEPPSFELAGPRSQLFFDPASVRCGIITCGGLCPGLNDVIRSLVMTLRHRYGVPSVLGFPYGYEGLVDTFDHEPVELTTDRVDRITELGGTILGSSRGRQPAGEIVDTLERQGINLLFTIGGDGTLAGAHAIVEEVQRRGLDIAVVGVPKTIDNDISYIDVSFGFETAVEAARQTTRAAFIEASSHRNCVGLVKLMGRESGSIAAYAALADSQVALCLVPEVPFTLDAVVRTVQDQLARDGHTMVVVAEGAGQDLVTGSGTVDSSGNEQERDIGTFLRDQIRERCGVGGRPGNVKYIDPSYTIRSLPANARDAAFCVLLGEAAVHAGMTGRTDMLVGSWHGRLTHVPIPLAISSRKKVDHQVWQAVLAATGQPRTLT